MLTTNRIFIERSADVGVLPLDVGINYGVTGPSLRGSGSSFDLRKDEPYSVYDKFDFDVPVGQGLMGTVGDCWDRYYVKILEMKESAKMLVPGTMFKEYNKEVGEVMESELIKLGLLDKHDVLKQDPENPLFKKYFMHGTSHYLGLDVHDVGNFDWPMKEGMVFTCEPGIYILEEELGIRLENDILVTADGPDDLMKNIPIEIEEIEDLMNI